jgi:uncharacterized protein YjiS (DUF1127 family)
MPSIRMEFFMSRFYLATVVAIIVTTSLASNVLAIAVLGPTRPDPLVRFRLGLRRSPRHIKRLVDAWVASMLARRERQAAVCALDGMSDRELRDSGLSRGRIDDAVCASSAQPGRLR